LWGIIYGVDGGVRPFGVRGTGHDLLTTTIKGAGLCRHWRCLAPNFEALFGKELCDLLVSLEAANPGYGKEIACVLAGNASKDLKVEKSLRSRRKNRIITIKLPQLLESSYLARDDPNVVS
jgi:hypothetical protein